jgi:cytochrome c-type biogenesis protein CcmH/NrfG
MVHDEVWRPKVVYGMATVCLLLGLAIGYLLRGSESHAAAASSVSRPSVPPAPASGSMQMPSLEQMKTMADKKVEPLLSKLKSDPKNKDLLLQIAFFYKSAHQFKDAASYFDRALQLDPKNTSAKTEMASCLYYDGDVDGAVAALESALRTKPDDPNSLFNLGVIRWKGKKDASGAISAWKELLRTNPNLDKKAIVEGMIAEAQGKSH